jgi:hypothetical protein
VSEDAPKLRSLWRRIIQPDLTVTVGRAIVFLFLLAMLFSVGSYLLSTVATERSTRSLVSTQQLCLSANESRHEQIQLWDFVLTISKPPPHETAAERVRREQQLTHFRKFLERVFADRNCGVH